MRKVWVLASIAIAVVSLTVPTQAAADRQRGGGASSSPPTMVIPSLSSQAQLPLPVGWGSNLTREELGTDCGPSPSGLSGSGEGLCLSFDGQLGHGAQGVADLDAGGLLVTLRTPMTAQGPVSAQGTGTAADQDRWVFSFTPYIWLPASASALSVGPLSTSFSVGPFQGSPFGLMGHFDAAKGKWGYFVDLVYSNAFYGSLGPLGNTSVLTTAWLGELGASYRLAGPGTTELLANWGTVQQPPTFDVYLGIKGFSVTESLTVNFPLLGPQNASRTLTVAAPMVGVRARWDLNSKWSLLVDANVDGLGGSGTYIFGYGGVVVFSYKVEAFHLPAAWSFGARVLDMNLGSGDFTVNQTLYGPLVGFTVFF